MMKSLVFVQVLCILTLVQCGYRLTGTGEHIPDSIKTVAIPDFENRSKQYDAGRFVTTAIREEFSRRGHLSVVDKTSGADSLIEGEIENFDIKPSDLSGNESSRLYDVNIKVHIKFIDLHEGKIIYEGKNLSFRGSYKVDIDNFFSPHDQSALKISKKFASAIVSTILESF